jgi:hypothetical protein
MTARLAQTLVGSLPSMVGRGLRVVLAAAVVVALLGVEPAGLRSEPEQLTSGVTAAAQNGATGVHADQGAHGATIAAAARSIEQALERWRPLTTLIAFVVALILASTRPARRLRLAETSVPIASSRSGPPSLRAPPASA